MRFSLPFSDEDILLLPRWGEADTSYPYWAAIFCLFLLGGLLLRLFYWEARLIRRSAAVVLFAFRLSAIALLCFVACFAPTLVNKTPVAQPGRVIVALDVSGSMNLTDTRSPLEQLRLSQSLSPRSLHSGSKEMTSRWIRHLEGGGQVADLPWLTDEELGLDGVERGKRTRQRQRDFATLQKEIAGWSRLDVARRILGEEGGGLLKKLEAVHQVEMLVFADALVSGTADGKEAEKSPQGSDLRLPLVRALGAKKEDAAPLLGVILLSDGRHNIGENPTSLASRLGRLGMRVYPVDVSGEAVLDLALLSAKAPATTLRGMEFALQAQVQASRMPGQEILIEVFRKGEKKPLAETKILHKGNEKTGKPVIYSVAIPLKIEEVGTHSLELKARLAKGEIKEASRENNSHPAVVRVVQEKPRVLLVDGEARWEYHYLSTFLTRAPNLEVERVLFQQPRLGLQPDEKLEEIGFARRVLPALKDEKTQDDPLFAFDCILLGDVDPEDLPWKDRQRLHRYVTERGGTLVLISGKRHLPRAYGAKEDPLQQLLPVTDVQTETPKEKGFGVELSELGKATAWLALGDDPEQSLKTWSELPPHFWGLTGKAKPGATVLATKGSKKDKQEAGRGLIVQQNFGLGRVLWLGIESTWRYRRGADDTHHHRFWGQLVLWAGTKDLLPAGDTHVRYGSRQPVYSPNQDADLAVRLGSKVPVEALKGKATMKVIRLSDAGKDEAAVEIALEANPSQPRLLEGKARNLEPGRYRVEPVLASLEKEVKEALAAKGGDPTFTVLPALSKEMLDPSPDKDLLRTLARESGAKVYSAGTTQALLGDLEEQLRLALERRGEKTEKGYEKRLWRDDPFVWWLFALVSGFLTLEWLGRKWVGLP